MKNLLLLVLMLRVTWYNFGPPSNPHSPIIDRGTVISSLLGSRGIAAFIVRDDHGATYTVDTDAILQSWWVPEYEVPRGIENLDKSPK